MRRKSEKDSDYGQYAYKREGTKETSKTRMLLGRKQKRDSEYGWYQREGSKGTVNEDAICL